MMTTGILEAEVEWVLKRLSLTCLPNEYQLRV
jgi:hypothetical protein